jgi:hypothetical protein
VGGVDTAMQSTPKGYSRTTIEHPRRGAKAALTAAMSRWDSRDAGRATARRHSVASISMNDAPTTVPTRAVMKQFGVHIQK